MFPGLRAGGNYIPGSVEAMQAVCPQNLRRQYPGTAALVVLVVAEDRSAFDWLAACLSHHSALSITALSTVYLAH